MTDLRSKSFDWRGSNGYDGQVRILKLVRSRDIIRRLQSKPNGLLLSSLILLAASFAADLFPLGVMATKSFIWMAVRLVLQSITAIVLVTWMWIVFNVFLHTLRERNKSPVFPFVRVVLVLSIAAIIFLNGLPHTNTSGGHSFGWPFRFMYGMAIVSPFAGILDLAHALIVVAFLLNVVDRAMTSKAIPTPT